MPGIGFGELAVIFLLLLVFVGPQRLPQVARTMGRVMMELRRTTDELKSALYFEEARMERERRGSPPPRPPTPRPRSEERPDAPRPDPPDTATTTATSTTTATTTSSDEDSAPSGDGETP
jgi:sec-independent protein translocase protein TatB